MACHFCRYFECQKIRWNFKAESFEIAERLCIETSEITHCANEYPEGNHFEFYSLCWNRKCQNCQGWSIPNQILVRDPESDFERKNETHSTEKLSVTFVLT